MFEISDIARKAWNRDCIWAILVNPNGMLYYLCDDPFYAEKIAILKGDVLYTMFTRKGDGWHSEDFKEFKKRHKLNETGTRENGEGPI